MADLYIYLPVNDSRSRLLAPIVDEALADFILRIAMSDASPKSNLVLQAVLAIAALRLQGHSRGFQYKGRTISILKESIIQLDRDSVLKNLTATMLLYQYEVLHSLTTKFL